MKTEEIIKMRDLAEVGKVQFKERIIDIYDAGCELVAFSNSRGGKIVIGIDDKSGKINPLSYMELQETNISLKHKARKVYMFLSDDKIITWYRQSTFLRM